MKQIRWILRIIGKNWKAFVSFEILIKIISTAAILPLFRLLLDQSLRLSGLRYLTAENLHRFLKTPVPYVVLPFICLLYALLEFFEIGVLIFLFDRCRHAQKARMGRAVLWSARSCGRLFSGRSDFKILPAVLILSPFFHFATIMNMFWSYSISERLLKFILKRWYQAALFAFFCILFLLLFLRWVFACHYFHLEDFSGHDSLKRSRRLGKKIKIVRSYIPVIYVQLIMTILYVLLMFTGLVLIELVRHVLSLHGAGVSSFQVIFINTGVSVFDALILVITYACISELFYKGKHKLHEEIPYISDQEEKKPSPESKKARYVERGLYIVSVLLLMFYFIVISRTNFRLRVHGLQNMQVTAHRGASLFYPENTMPAFTGAVEQGADWIELDVQESADGMIYVMHDTSFLRTALTEGRAWETGWDEIAGMDVGSWFGPAFAGTKVPLLSEVIEFAKDTGVMLNIEIKPSGHEKNLTEKVVRLIEEEQFMGQCVITSQAYDVIKEVKELNEEIITVYVMGLAYGAINKLTSADAFSIRSTSISRSLVRDLHNRGLEVYAWTVDSRRNINRMIDFGVDNIITNNVPLAIECINDSKTNSIMLQTVKMIRDLIRNW